MGVQDLAQHISEVQKNKQQHMNETDTQNKTQLKTLNSIDHAWNSEERNQPIAHDPKPQEK